MGTGWDVRFPCGLGPRHLLHRLTSGYHPRQRRCQQTHFDMLTFAGVVAMVESRQDANGGMEPGQHVEDRYAGAKGRPTRISVRLINPETACTTRSYPGREAPLSVPKPLIEA